MIIFQYIVYIYPRIYLWLLESIFYRYILIYIPIVGNINIYHYYLLAINTLT